MRQRRWGNGLEGLWDVIVHLHFEIRVCVSAELLLEFLSLFDLVATLTLVLMNAQVGLHTYDLGLPLCFSVVFGSFGAGLPVRESSITLWLQIFTFLGVLYTEHSDMVRRGRPFLERVREFQVEDFD